MNKTLRGLGLCVGILMSFSAHAEISIVNIKKVEKDLYKTRDGLYIETHACYEHADGDNAVLDYEKYACNNSLRFGSDRSCKVLYVFK